MSSAEDSAAAVARLASALERQADELRSVRSHLGLAPAEASVLLRADDVAQRLAKSRAWVYRNQQALGGFRVGGQVRFTADAIDTYLDRCRQVPAGRPVGATEQAPLLPVLSRSSPTRGPNAPAAG